MDENNYSTAYPLTYLLPNNSTSTSDENPKCDLLGTFSFLVQIILGFLAFTVLIIKRYCDKPRRSWKIWFFDVSKQIISACTVHALNLVIAIFLSISIDNTADQCIWYFLNLLVDTTIGILICFGLMHLVDKLAVKYDLKYLKSGLYFEKKLNRKGKLVTKLKLKMYFSQLSVWIIVSFISKLLLLGFSKLFYSVLETIGNFILSPFTFNEKIELMMVMIVFPLVFNSIQFWVLDNILKLPSEEVQIENQADMQVNDVQNVNQLNGDDNRREKNEINNDKVADYVPPPFNIELAREKILASEEQILDTDFNEKNEDAYSNSSSNTNDVKILVERSSPVKEPDSNVSNVHKIE